MAERIFYDGQCGLCHWAVRFVLARDKRGDAFRFAPLDSDAFRTAVPDFASKRPNETMVVLTTDGQVLMRSSAAIHIARRLGGSWRILAEIVRFIPTPLRDWSYDLVARNRHRLFAKPDEACPIMPPHLRARFDL